MTDNAAGDGAIRPVISWKESLIVFMGIALLFLFLFGPVLGAKFYIIEDHLIVTGCSWGISDWATRIAVDINVYQRFRPAYWLYLAAGGVLFGTNPLLWHAATILWGVLTCYLFYVALRKIGADAISSLVFVLLLVVSGNQNWIWINLIPQETIGMLLTAIAVWAIVLASQRARAARWDVLALIAMALAGLAKESFVILIPALLLLRWVCQKRFSKQSWQQALRRLRVPLTAGALVFMIELAPLVTILLSKSGGDSKTYSLSVSGFDPRLWLQIVLTLGLYKQLLLAASVLLWVTLWFSRRSTRPYLLVSIGILAAWLIPQVVLYGNGLNERYLFPAIVSVAGLIALGLSILWRRRLWFFWLVGMLLLMANLAKGVGPTTQTASWFAAETVTANRAVEFLAQTVSADQTILMAGDSGTPYGYEATYSLPLYLKLAGSNSPFYLWPLVALNGRTSMHIAASNNNTAFRYPDALTPRNVGAIIIISLRDGLDFKPLSDWLGDTLWREINFTKPYRAFSIRKVKYIEWGEVSHTVIVPLQTASDVPDSTPLITIHPTLRGTVRANPLLTAPWGIDRDYAGHPGSTVWLGQGDEQGFGGVLLSTQKQPVEITFTIVPGPGRPDHKRTVEFSVANHAGQETQEKVIESQNCNFSATLQPGVNHFKLRVLDKATVLIQPNGDTRPLLALLHHMTVTPLKNNRQ